MVLIKENPRRTELKHVALAKTVLLSFGNTIQIGL